MTSKAKGFSFVSLLAMLICPAFVPGARASSRTVNVQFGGNRLAPEKYKERQYQLANTLFWNRGNQTVTIGTDNIVTQIQRRLPVEQRGLFEFDNLAQLDALTAARYSRQVPLRDGGTTADFTVACAVIRITGRSRSLTFTCLRNSMPSIAGMERSVITRSGWQ